MLGPNKYGTHEHIRVKSELRISFPQYFKMFTTISLALIFSPAIFLVIQRQLRKAKQQQQQQQLTTDDMSNTIVILGASFAGLAVAHSLLKSTASGVKGLKVIVVGPNTDLYWNIGSVRAIVPGQMEDEKVP
jgi:hypothetical protein